MEELRRYKELKQEIDRLQYELSELAFGINSMAMKYGEVAGYGVRAYMKPGRKTTDHEAAYNALMDEINAEQWHDSAQVAAGVVAKYTTTKITVAWAKVTGALKIDTAPFTTEGEPSFVIEID